MRIDYPVRSKFLQKCENEIQANKDSLLEGESLSIKFSSQGYNGTIMTKIDAANSTSFESDWEDSDPTRFPVRIKAAAYALYRQGCFGSFKISHNTGILTIRFVGSPFGKRDPEHKRYEETQKAIQNISEKNIQVETRCVSSLTKILSQIPWEVWESITRHEPEWYDLKQYLETFGFGPFSVLMLMTGLNDYQLKGKAEVAYWPEISKIVKNIKQVNSPKDLIPLLTPFYYKERLPGQKIKRLHTFLQSPLANRLWNQKPEHTSREFGDIWLELAKVMRQSIQAKTISFAMKCLGLSLMMVDIFDFDYSQIPIPVDYRIKQFTEKIKLCDSNNAESIRKTWNDVLYGLQKTHPKLTMIHLDSLIWQIGTLDEQKLQDYFSQYNLPLIAQEIISLSQSDIQGKNIMHNNLSNLKTKTGKIMCFIPCCKSKDGYGGVIDESCSLSHDNLPTTWKLLESGRKQMKICVDEESEQTSALHLYSGKLYRPLQFKKEDIINQISSGHFQLYIISAGYGILDAFEPINSYEAVLSGKNASLWARYRLIDIIAELIMQENPSKVYGFFSGSSTWQSSGSMYRYFFTEGVKKALQKGLSLDVAGCFYKIDGGGFPSFKELTVLGKMFVEMIDNDFNDQFVEGVKRNNWIDDDVVIGFDQIK